MSSKIFTSGELLVVDKGEVTIDEIVPKSRALLVRPGDFIHVEFDPSEPECPPCAGGDMIDEIRWELIMSPVMHHHHHAEEQLRLRIKWRVSTARTILWKIKIPV